MPDGSVTCRRCGVTNTTGDQFCGSCGAFLEWEGDPTEPGSPPEPGPPTESPPPAPAQAATAPQLVQPPQTVPPPPPTPMVPCPSCGTLNPAQRVFCQSCGTDLRDAARAETAAGTAPAAARATPAPKSGGMPFWLPIVAGIGVLAGVGIVVASVVMRPAPVPPEATTAASVTFTPTLPPSPAVTAGSSSGAGTSPPTVESIPLAVTGATASSVVGDRPKFNADKAVDGDLETCWQEGAAEEKGQWLEVSFAPSLLDYLVVYSGYQLSSDTFRGNRRPENVLVTVDGGPPVAFILADSEQPQRLDLDDVPGATTVRIEIVSTFDAIATAYPGSPFDDLAITEIRVYGGAP